MSRIHILERTSPNTYRAVVHNATPGGNNSAGFSWASVIVNSGKARSVMTVGTGPGQISTAENNTVLAGTVLEGVFEYQDDTTLNATQRNAAIDAMATQVIAELQARLADELKWYGAVRT